MIRLKKTLNRVACLCATALIASCGEMFQQEWPEEFDPDKLLDVTGLGIDEGRLFVLCVGEEYKLNPQVGDMSLDELQEKDQEIVLSRFHASTEKGDEVVRVRQTDIMAVSVGKDIISFTNSKGSWSTRLSVSVLPSWVRQSLAGWRYETIVYANVTVNDEMPSNDCVFGAFCDDELRGRGVTRTVKGVTYVVFRIGSNNAYGEIIRFEGLDTTSGLPITFDETITFDGGTHGTLSDLYELKGKK